MDPSVDPTGYALLGFIGGVLVGIAFVTLIIGYANFDDTL